MTQTVNVPGVGPLNFPDGMSDADMASAIQKNYPQIHQSSSAPQEKPGFGKRMLGAGVSGMLQGGPIPAIMNMAGEGLNTANDALSSGAYKAGGAVTDLTGSPELGFATNVGIQAAPALAGGAIARTASPLLEKGGRWLMQSALKPSVQAMQSGKGQQAITTMLREGANVTSGGIGKLQTKADALGQQVDDLVSNSSKTIDKNAVVQALKDTVSKFTNQVNPNSDLDAINSVAQEFLAKHPSIPTNQIPVQLAQDLKQGTYRVLGDKSYGTELTSASRDAQKALARGLKQEIEKQIPEVGPINAQQSDLINAIKLASRREYIAGNKNPAGLALLPHSPIAGAAFLADRSELIKSLLARLLYSGKNAIPEVAGGAAGGAYSVMKNEGNQP